MAADLFDVVPAESLDVLETFLNSHICVLDTNVTLERRFELLLPEFPPLAQRSLPLSCGNTRD